VARGLTLMIWEQVFRPSACAREIQAFFNATLSKSSQWLGCF
jgi:hypothetical protein